MYIHVEWYLGTDGDYRLENYQRFGGEAYSEYTFHGQRGFYDKNEFNCACEASEYLEEMLVSMRVDSNHYFLLEWLYDIFDEAINFVNKRKSGEYHVSLPGNYDSTELMVDICV